MHTIALISGGKDSMYSIYQAQKDGKEIDRGVCFVNNQNYIQLDTGPQPGGSIVQDLFETLSFPVHTIELENTTSSKKIFDTVSKHIQEFTQNSPTEIILGELRDTEYSSEIKKRIPDVGFYTGYTDCTGPTQYLEKIIKTIPNIIISGTKIPFIRDLVGKKFDQHAIDIMRARGMSDKQILGENDEIQTLVMSRGAQIPSTIKTQEIISTLNKETYWILEG